MNDSSEQTFVHVIISIPTQSVVNVYTTREAAERAAEEYNESYRSLGYTGPNGGSITRVQTRLLLTD